MIERLVTGIELWAEEGDCYEDENENPIHYQCREAFAESKYRLGQPSPNCSQYNLKDELVSLIKRLVKGIEDWGCDVDGVHPACWDAYKEAKIRLFQSVNGEEV